MPLDSQIAAMLSGAQWPGAAQVPIEELRALVRQFSMASGPLPVPLAAVRDQTIPGPAGEIPVRVYTPVGDGPFPLIVYFHGGGYVTGDLDTQDMIARALTAGARAVTVSVDYRLAPEHPFPAGIEDAYAALVWSAGHAKALGADAQRLAVAGDSAGANFAAALALMAKARGGPRITGQVLFYGSANYPDTLTDSAREFDGGPVLTGGDVTFFWETYLTDPEREKDDERASPYRAASHAGLPPAYVGTAEIDPTRDDAERYGEKLADAGVPVVTKRYAGMPHGFVSWLGIVPMAQTAMDDACAFLKSQWAGDAA
jgi:acetyl esterase